MSYNEMNPLLQRKENELPTTKGPGAAWHAHTLPQHQVSEGQSTVYAGTSKQ